VGKPGRGQVGRRQDEWDDTALIGPAGWRRCYRVARVLSATINAAFKPKTAEVTVDIKSSSLRL
jgi:hypothetical protein